MQENSYAQPEPAIETVTVRTDRRRASSYPPRTVGLVCVQFTRRSARITVWPVRMQLARSGNHLDG
jgi:hypothetical protein